MTTQNSQDPYKFRPRIKEPQHTLLTRRHKTSPSVTQRKQDVIKFFCELSTYVSRNLGAGLLASDCFCDNQRNTDSFVVDQYVTDYIEKAVKLQLEIDKGNDLIDQNL